MVGEDVEMNNPEVGAFTGSERVADDADDALAPQRRKAADDAQRDMKWRRWSRYRSAQVGERRLTARPPRTGSPAAMGTDWGDN